MSVSLETGYRPATSAIDSQTYRTIALRILPLLFVCYAFAFLDRVNIGFAKLQMQADLQFSEAVFGLGASIFFLPYFFLEIPSNLAMRRYGARRWFARIMATWGILSAATAFVTTPTQFYVVRFLLGAAEAGFFPGVLLYLTYWFPARERGRAISLFMTALPFSVLVGGPLSGWVLQLTSGSDLLRGWQWMFLIEGLPSVLLAVLCWFYLDDTVDDAKWLTTEQKSALKANLGGEERQADAHRFGNAARDPKIWLVALTNFTVLCSIVVTLWLPSLYKKAGVASAVEIGWMTAVPFGIAIVAMVLIARSSDRTGERRWHTALPAFTAAIGCLLMIGSLEDPNLLLASSTLTVASYLALNVTLWTLPTTFLTGGAAVIGIAFINAVGQLGGLVSPVAFGWLFDWTGAPNLALTCLAALYVVGGLSALLIPKAAVNR